MHMHGRTEFKLHLGSCIVQACTLNESSDDPRAPQVSAPTDRTVSQVPHLMTI